MQTENIEERKEENRTLAAQYFHGKERFNCCQAVMKAFADKTGMTDDDIREQFASHGGGRAPEGVCGALHAARELLDKENFNILADKFEKAAGAKTCREIRSARQLPCVECVELVGQLLSKDHL